MQEYARNEANEMIARNAIKNFWSMIKEWNTKKIAIKDERSDKITANPNELAKKFVETFQERNKPVKLTRIVSKSL